MKQCHWFQTEIDLYSIITGFRQVLICVKLIIIDLLYWIFMLSMKHSKSINIVYKLNLIDKMSILFLCVNTVLQMWFVVWTTTRHKGDCHCPWGRWVNFFINAFDDHHYWQLLFPYRRIRRGLRVCTPSVCPANQFPALFSCFCRYLFHIWYIAFQ